MSVWITLALISEILLLMMALYGEDYIGAILAIILILVTVMYVP